MARELAVISNPIARLLPPREDGGKSFRNPIGAAR
jgi:hypothetical protein